MAAHNRLGKEGEDAVAAYLERQGYTILHRNWRKNRLELDIVAMHEVELVVVEVKTRTNTEYKEPQEAVDWRATSSWQPMPISSILVSICPSASTSSRPLATGLRSRSSIWRMLSIRHNFNPI